MNRKLTIIALGFFITTCSLDAKVKLATIFSDNMVLQQQSKNKIWGQANANTTIYLTASWDNKKHSAKSDSKGYFSIEIITPDAGGPYTMEISDGEKLNLNNILIGEVWLCSGQSNMEMPLKGFRGQPIANSQCKIIGASPTQNLRLFTVKRAYNTSPQSDVEGLWSQSVPQTAREFSATAYYFGDLLQKTLNVPLGLIHSSWSASKIEAWMSKETLSHFSEIDMSVLKNTEFEYPASTPSVLYNAMINPLTGLSIRGVIWYQGESNSANPKQYKKMFAAWAEQWRTNFNNPQMPIYYTEIAPFQSSDKNAINLAIFREAQLESMNELQNVGMAATTDLGHQYFIHPPFKQQVGERLAYWALSKTYKIEGISYMGPSYKSLKLLEDNSIEVVFKHGEEGLIPENEDVVGFEIAGADGEFKPAKATIINGSSRVKVWNDEIYQPKEVRYCFRNYTEGNLYNNFGIPAIAFRASIK
ncbi:hypothetical protein AwDysgo_20910 [Bacteroidales bacterium]|nr:hypothetical protein AwDysgo_20910 [Bacteroidales bacterium]